MAKRLTPLERAIATEALKLHRTGIKTFRVPDFAKFCKRDHAKPCLHPSVRNALSHLVKKQVLVRDMKGMYRVDPELALPSMQKRFTDPETPDMVAEYLRSLKKAVEEGRAKFEFHDVNLIVHIDNIYALFQQAELLPYCLSEDTRILTRKGFVNYHEIKNDGEIATLNSSTSTLEYQRPEEVIVQDYSGPMLRFGGFRRTFDLLVTPNHKMFVKRRSTNEQELIEAKALKSVAFDDYTFKRDAGWLGQRQDYFELPSVESRMQSSLVQVTKTPINIWLRLFGWWLSEGSAFQNGEGNYVISFSNHDEPYLQEIASLIREIGFSPMISKRKDEVKFYSKQVYAYLKQFGHAREKFIPHEIKELPREQLKVLLESMVKGDGSSVNPKWGTYREQFEGQPHSYFTSSRRLAEDVAEIGLKCGYGVTISSNFGGFSKHRKYRVGFSLRNKEPRLLRGPNEVEYKGKIWCVTVPNHIILAERNGKTCWTGNSWHYDWKYSEKLKMEVGNKKFILTEEQRLSKDRFVKFSITPQDTVEVFVRSSEHAFEFSDRGMLDLHQALVESRGVLASFLKAPVRIPDAMDWVVVQWQRNVDSPDEVAGPRCNIRFTGFAEQVGRFYIKEFSTGEVRSRAELIEQPGRTVQEMHSELMQTNSPFMTERVGLLQRQLRENNLSLDEVKRTMISLAANLESHIGVIKEMAARREAERETLDGLTAAVSKMNDVLDRLNTRSESSGLADRIRRRLGL